MNDNATLLALKTQVEVLSAANTNAEAAKARFDAINKDMQAAANVLTAAENVVTTEQQRLKNIMCNVDVVATVAPSVPAMKAEFKEEAKAVFKAEIAANDAMELVKRDYIKNTQISKETLMTYFKQFHPHSYNKHNGRAAPLRLIEIFEGAVESPTITTFEFYQIYNKEISAYLTNMADLTTSKCFAYTAALNKITLYQGLYKEVSTSNSKRQYQEKLSRITQKALDEINDAVTAAIEEPAAKKMRMDTTSSSSARLPLTFPEPSTSTSMSLIFPTSVVNEAVSTRVPVPLVFPKPVIAPETKPVIAPETNPPEKLKSKYGIIYIDDVKFYKSNADNSLYVRGDKPGMYEYWGDFLGGRAVSIDELLGTNYDSDYDFDYDV